MADYQKELDFLEFIFEKGREFEAGILRLLKEMIEVTTIAQRYQDIIRLEKAEETFAVMNQGAPIIYQPVLMGRSESEFRFARFPGAQRCLASALSPVC